jgi:arylsulfatase
VRAQFCHAVDVLPTVLEAAGEQLPALVDGIAQQPVDGASLVATFDDADAPSPRPTQYFEMLGSRAVYSHGWKATTDHVGRQITVEWKAVEGSHDFEDDHWALFNLDEDFAEANDLSDQQPQRVKRLIELWWAEAGRNQVLPLEDSLIARALTGAMEPAPYPPRHRTRYLPGAGPIDEVTLPSLGAGFLLTAQVDLSGEMDPATEGRPHGILCALGDWNNEWAWYLVDGRPVVVFALFSREHRIAADAPVGGGAHQLTIEYRREGRAGGPVTLGVDGEQVAAGRLPANLPFRWQIGSAGLLIGRDQGFPVSDDYRPPFCFSGMIDHLVFEIPTLAPALPSEEAGQISTALRRE